jgi:hypothetical protein
MTTAESATKDLVWLCRALKAPSLAAGIERLADRARSDGWTYEGLVVAEDRTVPLTYSPKDEPCYSYNNLQLAGDWRCRLLRPWLPLGRFI